MLLQQSKASANFTFTLCAWDSSTSWVAFVSSKFMHYHFDDTINLLQLQGNDKHHRKAHLFKTMLRVSFQPKKVT